LGYIIAIQVWHSPSYQESFGEVRKSFCKEEQKLRFKILSQEFKQKKIPRCQWQHGIIVEVPDENTSVLKTHIIELAMRQRFRYKSKQSIVCHIESWVTTPHTYRPTEQFSLFDYRIAYLHRGFVKGNSFSLDTTLDFVSWGLATLDQVRVQAAATFRYNTVKPVKLCKRRECAANPEPVPTKATD
jgi:hypothetical protein